MAINTVKFNLRSKNGSPTPIEMPTKEYVAEQVSNSITEERGSSSNNYSTEEQRIGTWIDGKPLYQITFSTTSPSSAGWGTVQDLSSLNLSNCIHQYGFCIYSSTEWIDIPYNNGYTICQCAINLSSGGLRLYISSDCISKPCYITLQYTKTTD